MAANKRASSMLLLLMVVIMLLLDVSCACKLQFKKGSTLSHPHGVLGMSSKYMHTNKV